MIAASPFGGSSERRSVAREESAFLLACLRCHFCPSTPVPSDGVDWDRLLALAERHMVAPLLSVVLHAAPGAAPPAVLARLRERAQETARFNLALSAELVRLTSVFEGERIDVLSLKGPVLSEMLYGSLARRAFTDLDLLVHKKDLSRARRTLETQGYRLESSAFRARESQLSFADGANLVSVDVHWRMVPAYFPAPIRDAPLWATPYLVPIGRGAVRTLSPEHLLLFLCGHGTKHGWYRLAWTCDVAQLLWVERGIDWSDVIARAHRNGVSRMLHLGVRLASDLLGVELPAAAVFGADARVEALVADVRARLSTRDVEPLRGTELALFNVRAFDRASQRLRYVIAACVAPSDLEHTALRFPKTLRWLYYPLRPLRLMAKYIGRIARS